MPENTPIAPPMTWHQRRTARWVAMWGLLVASTAMVGLFLASLRQAMCVICSTSVQNGTPTYFIEAAGGVIKWGRVGRVWSFPAPGWSWFIQPTMPGGWTWRPHLSIGKGNIQGSIPFWIPFVIFASPGAVLFCQDSASARRRRIGMCAGCGYHRAGLAAGAVCPECGCEDDSARALAE